MQDYNNLAEMSEGNHPTDDSLLECVQKFVFHRGLNRISYSVMDSNDHEMRNSEYERIDKCFRPCVNIR